MPQAWNPSSPLLPREGNLTNVVPWARHADLLQPPWWKHLLCNAVMVSSTPGWGIWIRATYRIRAAWSGGLGWGWNRVRSKGLWTGAKEGKGQTTRQGSSSVVRRQALGLWPIKALLITDLGVVKGVGRPGVWLEVNWELETGLGESSRTRPKLPPPGISDFMIIWSSAQPLATFSPCPFASKTRWLCIALVAAAAAQIPTHPSILIVRPMTLWLNDFWSRFPVK